MLADEISDKQLDILFEPVTYCALLDRDPKEVARLLSLALEKTE